MKEWIRVLKFTFFSISAGLIELASFALLNEFTALPYWPCYLIALVLSVLWNFTLNRKFTFQSAANVPVAMAKVAAYYGVFTPLSTLLGNFLASGLLWTVVFFSGRQYALAFFWLVLYWLLAFFTALSFAKRSRAAGWLMVPYLLWLTFAGYLNFAVWRMN